MPEIDPAERVKQIEERAQKAREMISALCLPRGSAGHREWIMSIPARPDYDPDIVISDSLKDIPWLLSRMKEGEELRREIERLHQAERLDKTAENWAEDTMVELSELADADFDTRPQQVELLAKTLKDFLSREIAWREAGTETAELRTKLAAAEAEAERLRAELAQQQQISFHMDGAVADLRSRAESADKLLGSMREALRKLYSKRAAKIAAKEALREFRAEHGSCLDEGNSVDVPTLRCFREPDKPKEQWCEVCLGSQPLWEARQKAQAQAAAALRSILRIAAKLESENQAESVLSAANETKEEG